MDAGNEWPVGARVAWLREWRSPLGLQAAGSFANAGEHFDTNLDVFLGTYVFSYDEWTVGRLADPESTGIWDICPDNLAAGVIEIIWANHAATLDFPPPRGTLLRTHPRFDSAAMSALAPTERWVAARLSANAYFTTVPPLLPSQESPFLGGDFSTAKSFRTLVRLLQSSSLRSERTPAADFGTVLMVHAIARDLVAPITGARVLNQAFKYSRRAARAVGPDTTAYLIREELDGLEPLAVGGQPLTETETANLAADIAALCRNWTGHNTFWVTGSWSPGLHRLISQLVK